MCAYLISMAVLWIVLTVSCFAGASERYVSNGKELTKVQAVRTLALDPNASVVRCVDVELSEKATIRVAKHKK